jgi:GH15 family glucan-1,4-alpha-glucosidase
MPVSNGFSVAVYDTSQAKVTTFREHAYQQESLNGPRTKNVAFDAYFGVRSSNGSQWLNSLPVDSAEYANDEGIIKITQHQGPEVGGILLETYVITSFLLDHPSTILLLHATNTGTFNQPDVSLYSLLNFHLGADDQITANERISFDGTQYIERGTVSNRVMVYRPFPAASVHAASPNNPFTAVVSGQHLTETNDSGTTNDAVAGFEWTLPGGLAGGQDQWVAVAIGYDQTGDNNKVTQQLSAYLNGLTSADQILQKELDEWASWREDEILPDGMSADEAKVAKLSTAILRMGQSLEPGPATGPTPFGQIVASIHPGNWDIAWVRDGALAIIALAESGHTEEAKNGLLFMLRAQSGFFQDFVGVPYQISVTRYFGLGIEESDFNQDGPNIEFDDFGLFLFALGRYVDATDDESMLTDFSDEIFDKTADVLLSLVEPQTGLLKPDSSIWEAHFFNGAAKKFTFSNVAAVLGLREASKLAARMNDPRAKSYQEAADALQTAIESQLVDPAGLLAGSHEELQSGLASGTGYYDGAVLSAFVFEALPKGGEIAEATALGLKDYLSCENGRGVHRNDNGDSYDQAEWALIDLWLATTLRRIGEEEASEALLGWITAQAIENFGIVPELFDPVTGVPTGEIPMVGFGAGNYLLTLFQRAADQTIKPPPPPPPPPPPGGDEVIPSFTGGSCAVHNESQGTVWLLVLSLVALFVQRRRR